jgi:hypothetical protein
MKKYQINWKMLITNGRVYMIEMVQKGRRKAIKAIGGTFAGVTGLTVLASRAAAAKDHDIEVIPDSYAGYGEYAMHLPDPEPVFSDLEGSNDTVNYYSDHVYWGGEIHGGFIGTESDDASFNGRIRDVAVFPASTGVEIYVDGGAIY